MIHALLNFGYQMLMLLGGLWCHQLPERSPHVWGVQAPVCWRCSGILTGAMIFIIWLITKKRLPSFRLSLALAFLMPLDVLHAALSHGGGHHARRVLTGLLWGIFGTSMVLHLVRLVRDRVIHFSRPMRDPDRPQRVRIEPFQTP